MNKTELKIGCDDLANVIYAGKVRTYKDGHKEWVDDIDKRLDVTEMAIKAVIVLLYKLRETNECYEIEIFEKKYRLMLKEVDE